MNELEFLAVALLGSTVGIFACYFIMYIIPSSIFNILTTNSEIDSIKNNPEMKFCYICEDFTKHKYTCAGWICRVCGKSYDDEMNWEL